MNAVNILFMTDEIIQAIEESMASEGRKPEWLYRKMEEAGAGKLYKQKWDKWRQRGIPQKNLKHVAKVFNWDAASLQDGKVSPIPSRDIDLFDAPYVSIRPSMGGGYGPQEEHVVRLIEMSKHFLTTKFNITNTQNIAILTAYGRSMKPTFNDGDTLIVDRGVTVADVDDVYVIEKDGELFVKRVRRTLTGKVTIISDNPAFPPYDMEKSEFSTLRILGRVVTALDWKEP